MPVKLKTIYDKQEEIPEGFGELYAERNGKFELTAVEGVKTQADIDRVQTALVKERADHKAVKDKLVAFGDVDPATLPVMQEELAEAKAKLEAVAAGIATVEQEFLAYTVLPNKQTVGDWLGPQLAAAYESGQKPMSLPMLEDLR